MAQARKAKENSRYWVVDSNGISQKKPSRTPVSLLLPTYSSSSRQVPSPVYTTMQRERPQGGEAPPRRRLPLGTTPQQETQRAGVFSKVFQLTGSTSLQCTGLGWAVGGPVWVWRCGILTGNQALGLQWGLCAGTTPPPPPHCLRSTLSSPGTQGCSSSRNVSPGQVPETWGKYRCHFSFLSKLIFIFYGNIDDFPCISFSVYTNLIQLHLCIHHFFFNSLIRHGVTVCWVEFPVLYSQCLLIL